MRECANDGLVFDAERKVMTIDGEKCVGCGKCVGLCPMKNISLKHRLAFAGDTCTMCYRCVNTCPAKAITLLGKRVIEQGTIEKYLTGGKDKN